MKSSPTLRSIAVVATLVTLWSALRLPAAETKPGVEFVLSDKSQSANAAIMAYLGEPVPVPARLDAKYTPEGLAAAFTALCKKSGLRLTRLVVDDTEFPFLIQGTVEGSQDLRELMANLRSSGDYTYTGSNTGRSSDGTLFTMNITPADRIPAEHREAARRRSMIRLQMLMAKMMPGHRH